MQYKAFDWKQLFQLAHSEKDAAQRNILCEQARRLINDRSLELAEKKLQGHIDSTAEENALHQALRDLWMLQNQPTQFFDSSPPLRLVI